MELVEIIISLSEDEIEEIATLSRSALDETNEKLTRNHGARPVVELLEEHFYKLVTNLPRLIRRSGNKQPRMYNQYSDIFFIRIYCHFRRKLDSVGSIESIGGLYKIARKTEASSRNGLGFTFTKALTRSRLRC